MGSSPGRSAVTQISVPLLLFILASSGCSHMMEGAREHSSPFSEIPIPCRFECPVSPYAGPAPAEIRLDTLDVENLLEGQGIGSMYSANGSLTLICMDGTELAWGLEEDLANLLDRHSIVVGGDPAGLPPAGISLHVEIFEAWVESETTGTSGIKIPIEASVAFRATVEDETKWVTLWHEEFRGKDKRAIWYSLSQHHAESLQRAYCEAIRSFDAAIGSAKFQKAIRR